MIRHHDFHIDFIKNKKFYFGISIGLILIGLLFNIFFGTKMDIEFTGGAIINYSYTGTDVQPSDISKIVSDTTGLDAKVNISENIATGNSGVGSNNVSVEFAGTDALSLDNQDALTKAIVSAYPDDNFALSQSSSVDPTNGQSFFWKCMCAIAIACALMVIYIAIRFRRIGGWSAGVMAIVSLLHDVLIIYFTFVVFRMPIDDNFVAVVLTILGYSLNDTIIIYDRVRENRRLLGNSANTGQLVNTSINQTLQRTINTTITTAIAIASVLVVSIIFNVSSVITFAFPMLIGIVSGCYSTVCIAGPLWVMWQNRKDKKLAANAKASKNDRPLVSVKDDKKDNTFVKLEAEKPELIENLDLTKRGTGKAKLSKKERDKQKKQGNK